MRTEATNSMPPVFYQYRASSLYLRDVSLKFREAQKLDSLSLSKTERRKSIGMKWRRWRQTKTSEVESIFFFFTTISFWWETELLVTWRFGIGHIILFICLSIVGIRRGHFEWCRRGLGFKEKPRGVLRLQILLMEKYRHF